MLDAIESPSLQADWEKGETVPAAHNLPQRNSANTVQVYIQFTVQDTGRGLTNAEKELLFARFSQASPRTHINYGSLFSLVTVSLLLTVDQADQGSACSSPEGSRKCMAGP